MTKILLVEDDKSLREIYGVRLLAEGYDIVSAGDGEEALAMAIKERPALIVSDLMMPKISGFDMLDILRSTTETRDVKVIMMTALSSEDQRQRGEALGADRYLVKSQVGIEDVVRTVHEVLGDAPEPTPVTPEPAAEPVAAGAPLAAPTTQLATHVVTPAPTAPTTPPTQDNSAIAPAQANPDNSTPPATDPAPFVLPSAAPTPAAPSAPTEQTATEPATPADPAPTPAPEVEQPPVSELAPTPSPEAAPTTPTDTLPQPTAPSSSPSMQPTSHGGERVIQPLSQEPQPDMSKMMEQELSDQLESIQASPQPTPDSDDFTLPTPDAMAEPHGDLTLDALEPLPADDQPLDTGAAINAELANAASSQPQDDDTPFVLPTPAPMPTDPAPTPEPEQTSTPGGEPSPVTESAQPTAPQPPTNAFPPQPPVAS